MFGVIYPEPFKEGAPDRPAHNLSPLVKSPRKEDVRYGFRRPC